MVSMLGAASRGERKAVRRRGALLGAAICGLVLTVGAGVAQAAAPTVSGGSPSNVGATIATVTASVNAQGLSTTYHFEYVRAADYDPAAANPYAAGATTPETSAGNGSASISKSANVTGLDANTTYHWRLVATNADGTANLPDRTFTTAPPTPAVTGLSATNAGLTTATLNATINPQGLETTYSFQYVSAALYDPNAADPYAAGSKIPDPPVSIGADTTALPVTANLTGLALNTTYHWRVVATNAAGTTNSPDRTFSTAPPPAIVSATSSGIDTMSATLKAQINPNGVATTYYFQYGTTDAYGSTVPAPPPGTALGATTGQPAVSVSLTGLASSTTYHWRLVAINGAGTTEGGDHTFTTSPSEPGADVLPDGRVYELVSPYDTVGNDLLAAWGWMDGDHALLESVGTFADQTNGVIGMYASTRTASGWVTNALADPNDRSSGAFLLGAGDDLSHVYLQTVGGLLSAFGTLQDRRSDGSHVNIVPLDTSSFVGNSADGTAAFLSLSAGSPPLLPSDTHTSGTMLYRVKNGTLQLGGLVENDAVPACGSSLVGNFGSATSFLQTGISRNGNTYAFLSANPCPGTQDLYVRHNGVSTNISKPSDPNEADAPATFLGGDQHLTKVFFTTAAKLEPNDTNGVSDVYEYTVASGELTRITTGSAGSDAAAVTSALVSPDGSRVYFTTNTVFNGEGTGGQPNLWLWDDGTLKFIRALNSAITFGGFNGASTTPDGRFLLFTTTESLTGYDNTGANGQRVAQIFRYSESSNQFACISCNPNGSSPSGSAPSPGDSSDFSLPSGRAMSDDGRYVAFNSVDALVSKDRNARQDVYQWHDDRIALISSGRSEQVSTAANISASGRDIFFTSTDRLVPGVEQDNSKVYDARIGGGLPAPAVPVTTQCSGDDCQGQGSPPPPAPAAGSATLSGSGNSAEQQVEPDQTRLTVAKLSKTAIANWARTGRLSLKVTLGARGRASAKATALLPGHRRASTIASASKTRKTAGVVTLSLRLSKSARAGLHRRSLNVRLVVNSTGAAGPKTVNVTLKRQRASTRTAAAAAAAVNDNARRG